MICISITHKNLTAAKRECFACNDEEQIKLAGAVAKAYPEAGLVLLMTCNRSEIYMSGTDTDFVWLEQQFADTKKFPVEALKGAAMRYEGKSCLTHLCRVVCGLDSAVLGEVEIIRQVKQAYLAAKARGQTDAEMNMVFQGALRLAKEVAETSQMTHLPVSVGTLACTASLEFRADTNMNEDTDETESMTSNEMDTIADSNQQREDSEEKHILIIGAAGQMGSIVMRDLLDADETVQIVGTSRKHKQALQKIFSHDRVQWVHYDRRYEYLDWADVIISVTDSPHYTFLADKVAEIRKETKPQLFLDLAIPRDIDAEIGRLSGCVVKDLDYIKSLATENNRKKLSEAKKIELLIEEHVDEMQKLLAFRVFVGTRKYITEKLGEKSAMWLLYQLKDVLDAQDLNHVLKGIEDGVFSIHDTTR
ncbi:hypothetical protein [Wujia sp.]|uniref:hypothetical protein n=1 Tax=Wujia sp. TaxID=2944172 RepID=UPI003F7F1253